MTAPKNILLPYNGSAAAQQAVPPALGLAARTGATLHTLSVEVLRGGLPIPSGTSDAILDGVRERFDEAVREHAHGSYGPEDVHFVHATRRDIEATSAILIYAAAQDIDLIVMGTRGRRGLKRLVLGSVAEKVVRWAPCPVLTLNPHAEPKPRAIERILVPTDFSPRSREALSRTKALAARFDAEVDLFHAVEETLHPAFYSPSVQSIYDAQPDIEEQATTRLKELYRTTEGRDGPVTFSVQSGSAPDAIAEHAAEAGADLIVMSTNGRTGLAHLAKKVTGGNVAENVVRTAPCPVLSGRHFAPPRAGASGDGAAVATEVAQQGEPTVAPALQRAA